jgi:hypothetical protein
MPMSFYDGPDTRITGGIGGRSARDAGAPGEMSISGAPLAWHEWGGKRTLTHFAAYGGERLEGARASVRSSLEQGMLRALEPTLQARHIAYAWCGGDIIALCSPEELRAIAQASE